MGVFPGPLAASRRFNLSIRALGKRRAIAYWVAFAVSGIAGLYIALRTSAGIHAIIVPDLVAAPIGVVSLAVLYRLESVRRLLAWKSETRKEGGRRASAAGHSKLPEWRWPKPWHSRAWWGCVIYLSAALSYLAFSPFLADPPSTEIAWIVVFLALVALLVVILLERVRRKFLHRET